MAIGKKVGDSVLSTSRSTFLECERKMKILQRYIHSVFFGGGGCPLISGEDELAPKVEETVEGERKREKIEQGQRESDGSTRSTKGGKLGVGGGVFMVARGGVKAREKKGESS